MTEPENERSINIEELKNGSRVEFSRMVDQFSGNIFRLALRITGSEQDAEDILQETFIKAMHGIGQFEGRSSLSTWLFRIATNEALMLGRKRKPENRQVVLVEEEDEENDLQPTLIKDWCCLPETEFEDDEARRFLNKAVNELPESYRLVFILRDVQGLSVRETAETLDITETNVKQRLLRARLKLRELLSGYFVERMDGKGDER